MCSRSALLRNADLDLASGAGADLLLDPRSQRRGFRVGLTLAHANVFERVRNHLAKRLQVVAMRRNARREMERR